MVEETTGVKYTEEQRCKNCGNSEIELGYELDLCKECRDTLANRAIPIWIKGVFGLILLLMIFALNSFPKTINAGVAFERGLRADKATKYLTASNEYQKVVTEYPNSTLALARLFIAYYKIEDIDNAAATIKKIVGRTPSDKQLVQEVNAAVKKMDSTYYPARELTPIITKYRLEKSPDVIESLRQYTVKNPQDVFGSYYFAGVLFDQAKYDESEAIMLKLISTNPDFYRGYIRIAAIYREKGEYEKGIGYCNTVLAKNAEYYPAYLAMARIELKRHRDTQGLELARKAYALEKNDPQVIGDLALALHYNNLFNERDELLNLLSKNGKGTVDSLRAIFNGEIAWRN